MRVITEQDYPKIMALAEKWGIASIKIFQLHPITIKDRWDFLITLKPDTSSFMQEGFQNGLTELLRENDEEQVFTFTKEDLDTNVKHHRIAAKNRDRAISEAQSLEEFIARAKQPPKETAISSSADQKARAESDQHLDNPLDIQVPTEFLCALSKQLMEDPVIAPDKLTYERSIIEGWIKEGYTFSPVSDTPWEGTTLIPNVLLKEKIQQFKQKPPARPSISKATPAVENAPVCIFIDVEDTMRRIFTKLSSIVGGNQPLLNNSNDFGSSLIGIKGILRNKTLILCINTTVISELQQIADLLTKLPTITELELELYGIEHLHAKTENLKHLQILLMAIPTTVRNLSIRRRLGTLTVEELASLLQAIPQTVTHLHLRRNLLTKMHLPALSEYVKTRPSLVELDVSDNELVEIDLTYIKPELFQNRTLLTDSPHQILSPADKRDREDVDSKLRADVGMTSIVTHERSNLLLFPISQQTKAPFLVVSSSPLQVEESMLLRQHEKDRRTWEAERERNRMIIEQQKRELENTKRLLAQYQSKSSPEHSSPEPSDSMTRNFLVQYPTRVPLPDNTSTSSSAVSIEPVSSLKLSFTINSSKQS